MIMYTHTHTHTHTRARARTEQAVHNNKKFIAISM